MGFAAMVRLTTETIDYHALTESVRTPRAGAVVLFLGTVREITGDRQTRALDYEAYGEMAEPQMQQLLDEARSRWPIEKAALVHRVGHLQPGEVSVAVAVACPHRGEAFEAARFLIDRLKQTVPIWKRECYADGSTEWVHPGLSAAADRPSTT